MCEDARMPGRPDPTPEGALIGDATRRRNISARRIAPAAGITEARWRQIVNGYQSVGGQQLRVVAPAATLANMARVIGVTPDQLTAAGRADAAEILRRDLDQGDDYTDPKTGETYTAEHERELWALGSYSVEERRKLIYFVRSERARQEAERRQAAG